MNHKVVWYAQCTYGWRRGFCGNSASSIQPHLLVIYLIPNWLARPEGGTMLLFLFIILLVGWMLGFVVFHVSSFLIHLLLIIAVISLIGHLVGWGRSATV